MAFCAGSSGTVRADTLPISLEMADAQLGLLPADAEASGHLGGIRADAADSFDSLGELVTFDPGGIFSRESSTHIVGARVDRGFPRCSMSSDNSGIAMPKRTCA
jgi:hypothetical protein